MRKPATTAVISPLSGDAPLAMASAIDRGSATTATVRPASASARKLSSLYPSLRPVTSVGVSDFVLIVDQLRSFPTTARPAQLPSLRSDRRPVGTEGGRTLRS